MCGCKLHGGLTCWIGLASIILLVILGCKHSFYRLSSNHSAAFIQSIRICVGILVARVGNTTQVSKRSYCAVLVIDRIRLQCDSKSLISFWSKSEVRIAHNTVYIYVMCQPSKMRESQSNVWGSSRCHAAYLPCTFYFHQCLSWLSHDFTTVVTCPEDSSFMCDYSMYIAWYDSFNDVISREIPFL